MRAARLTALRGVCEEARDRQSCLRGNDHGRYRLYCTAVSGNCYKVALMLSLSKCGWEPVLVDYMGGETRGEKFRSEVNELGEIPVLEHGARRLTQSGAILTSRPAHGTLRGPQRGRAAGCPALDPVRQSQVHQLFRHPALPGGNPEERRDAGDRIPARPGRDGFRPGRAHLASKPFLVGEDPTIADLSLAGYVYYPEETGISWSAYPNIEAWKKRIAALPGWAGPYELMAPKPAA